MRCFRCRQVPCVAEHWAGGLEDPPVLTCRLGWLQTQKRESLDKLDKAQLQVLRLKGKLADIKKRQKVVEAMNQRVAAAMM